MIKRFIVVFLATVLIAASVNGGMAAAQSSSRDPIWPGLWDGANFDFSSIGGRPNRPSPSPSPAPAPNPNAYAALGDSVAAGLGLSPLPGGTRGDTTCGRSTEAYPYKVAASQGKTLMHIACSGARAGDLFTRQGVRGTLRAPQLRTAFANGTPGLISITAGANDVRWVTFLKKCYASRCGTATDTRVANAYQKVLTAKLHVLLLDIQRRSGGNPPTTVLTGYYNPLSVACSTLEPRFTAEEIAWATERLNILNQTIQSVTAQYSFATFAPVSFASHDACSADPWVQGQDDEAPFHPNAKGQDVIADAVLSAL